MPSFFFLAVVHDGRGRAKVTLAFRQRMGCEGICVVGHFRGERGETNRTTMTTKTSAELVFFWLLYVVVQHEHLSEAQSPSATLPYPRSMGEDLSRGRVKKTLFCFSQWCRMKYGDDDDSDRRARAKNGQRGLGFGGKL